MVFQADIARWNLLSERSYLIAGSLVISNTSRLSASKSTVVTCNHRRKVLSSRVFPLSLSQRAVSAPKTVISYHFPPREWPFQDIRVHFLLIVQFSVFNHRDEDIFNCRRRVLTAMCLSRRDLAPKMKLKSERVTCPVRKSGQVTLALRSDYRSDQICY